MSDMSSPINSAATKIILPLYIYPVSSETWEPLYEAIASHRTLQFVVILNPNSGPYAEYPNSAPGHLSLPGTDYCREIPKLTASTNVLSIGYVRIDYCKRPLSVVIAEIETYAAWHRQHEGLSMRGIYIDESPNHYSPERASYLNAVKYSILACSDFGPDPLIFHNPGTPPDEGLRHTADAFVTCEEPYVRYNGEVVRKRFAEVPCERTISAFQISGVPLDDVSEFTKALKTECAYLYVTDLVDDFYESFGKGWKPFIAAMDAQE